MKNKEMNKAEIKERLLKAYRHFAWRIMIYLKAQPEVLSENNNQEVFDAVREIQIKHHLRATPRYTREDASEFVDFMCELEAKKYGLDYYVEQEEMDLYRPSAEKNEEWQMMFYITLMFYDDDNYTKVVHDAVLAEEEAERLQKMNCNSVDGETK